MESQAGGTARCRRVLIGEDHPDAGETMLLLMEALGFEARLVRDGEAVVREALTFRPDIALLDIGLPRLSGFDAAQLIRLSNPGRKLLIVAVSGWAMPRDVELSREAGMDAHLAKPVELRQLMEIIDGFFGDGG